MTDTAHIEVTLRTQLPAALHACVLPLASVIAELKAGWLTPTEAAERLRAEVFAPLRTHLASQAIVVNALRLDIAPDSDVITIGNLANVKGVAAGGGATAQVAEGTNIVQAAPGSIAVAITTGASATRSAPPFMVPDLPTGFVPRPHEFERIVMHLLDRDTGHVAISAALRGAGGYGKTTLAAAVCHDQRIRAAFPDGILWVTLGEKPIIADLVGKMDDLIVLLSGGPRTGFVSLEAATTRMAELLGEQRCLLVIDDVWDADHLAPFLHGGPRTMRLITTRNRNTLPAETCAVDVDAMQQAEALALLGAGVPGAAADQAALQPLATRLGEWPLLLTIVNGVLRDEARSGATLAKALAYTHAGLDETGITVFDTESAEGRQHAVTRTLEISLAKLNNAARARFAELVIFDEDVNIPLATLQRYWGATGKLSAFAVKQVCAQLHARSLLLAYDRAAGTIRLHDVVRAYLIHTHQQELTGWHRALLDALRPPAGNWADLPAAEPYLWDHLAAHLRSAGREDELVATAQDLRYLARKLHLRNPLMAEADLRLAAVCASEDAALSLLQRVIANAGHLFSACAVEHDVQATLLSRVAFDVPLREHAARLSQALARPYLSPRDPTPDLPDLALLRTLEGHTNVVTGCTYSPDGATLASASRDSTVRVWDAHTGTLLRTLKGHTNAVTGCAFSPDGATLASASEDYTMRVWNAHTGTLLRTLKGHTNAVTGCAFSPDGATLASASFDCTVRLWDAHTGTLLRTLEGHTDRVNGCAFSPDDAIVASASSDETVRLWNAHTGALLRTLEGHTRGAWGCAFSPDGATLASASEDYTVRVWDAHTGTLLWMLEESTGSMMGCAFSPDGTILASASLDHTVWVWNAHTGTLLHILEGHTAPVSGCAFSPDGATLASTSWDSTVRVWDAHTGTLPRTLEVQPAEVSGCAFSPDGATLASASRDSTMRVWDAHTGALLRALKGHTSWVTGCAFSPDSAILASTSWDTTVRVWDAHTGMLLRTLEGHSAWVSGCAFSPDSAILASASRDSTVRVWDAHTGVLLRTLEEHTDRVTGCAFSPDSAILASTSWDTTVRVWDAHAGTLLRTLEGHTDKVTGCAFSPDGATLASASEDDTVRVWDAHTGALLHILEGHTAPVRGCTVSPDGAWLASASRDKTIRLWDARSGTCRALLAVDDTLTSCAFSSDGRHLLATGAKGIYWLQVILN